MVDQKGQPYCRNQQELSPEGVMVGIVCCLELEKDQIQGPIRTHYEEYLHNSVIWRDKVCKEVKVSRGEHQGKQDLTFA